MLNTRFTLFRLYFEQVLNQFESNLKLSISSQSDMSQRAKVSVTPAYFEYNLVSNFANEIRV